MGVLAALVAGIVGSASAGEMHLAQPDVASFPQVQLYLDAAGDSGKPIAGARAELTSRVPDRCRMIGQLGPPAISREHVAIVATLPSCDLAASGKLSA